MKIRSRKLFAAAVMLMMLLTACGEDKPDYESIKTDIIGVWCDVDGPEYEVDADGGHYRLYEFTPDGRIIYHMPDEIYGSVYYEDTYTINNDLLSVSGSMCRLSIENDILTMTFDSGHSDYRRMDIPEICEYGVICIDDELFRRQDYYLKTGEVVAYEDLATATLKAETETEE